MNKIYKVVWSKAKNCYIVASELAKSVTKSGRSVLSLSLAHNCRKLSLATALGISFLAGPTIGWALPEQSGAMTSGVQITAPAKEMSITGTADNNVINWRSFNIANDEKVGFDAKNYLNLINDSKSSRIDGTLNGAGNIYLVNPNGVIFGSDSSVNVGNLSVSTRPLSKVDRDAFLRGQNPLANAASNVGGDIVNLTDIKATKVLLEGNTITLTNNISNTNLNVRALTGVNVGFTDGDKPATEVNKTQFTKPLDDSSISNFKNSHNNFSFKALDGKTDLSSAKFTPYYSVRNIYELQNMQNNPDEQYLLGRDIDAGDTKDWNDGAGFAPIFGNKATNYAFTGVFDGNGFKIKNM